MIILLSLFLSLSKAYRIHRGDCYAVIDQYEYDLTRFTGMDAFTPTSLEYQYYIRICPEDFDESTTSETVDVFVLQCPQTGDCITVITQNSLDYKPRNHLNFSEGLIYYADSEPFSTDGGRTYKTLDLVFDLECDPTATTSNIDLRFTIEDQQASGSIIGRGKTSAACPKIVPSPTPTPAYEPDCSYIDRIDNNITYGIFGNLSLLNDGPFGIRSQISIANKNYILFYQPCERMLCPPTYTCSSQGYSSAWLCSNEGRTCDSYGVGQNDVSFVPLDSSHLDKGVALFMEDTSLKRSVNLTLTCIDPSSYPDGHINFPDTATLNGNALSLSGQAGEVCFTPIPTPTPKPDSVCHFDENDIELKLETLNHGQEGWSHNVRVLNNLGNVTQTSATLKYQPCGSLICPPGKYCAGDEDASVWLCYKNEDLDQCLAYGLYKNSVSFSLNNPSEPKDGVIAKYAGDMKREAIVTYLCDKSLHEHEISFSNDVKLVGRSLYISAHSKAVCTASSGLSGGAIFLIILACLIVVYIIGGFAYSLIKEGTLSFPHKDFWVEFGHCIVTAVTYMFSCGKNSEYNLESKYDKI